MHKAVFIWEIKYSEYSYIMFAPKMGSYYLKFLCKIPVFGLFSENKRDSHKYFMQGTSDKAIILL